MDKNSSHSTDEFADHVWNTEHLVESSTHYRNAYTSSPRGHELKPRNIGLCIILVLITGGIYGLYWIYRQTEDIRILSNDTESTSGTCVVTFSLLTLGLYLLYWMFLRGEWVEMLRSKRNVPPLYSQFLYPGLTLLGVSIVANALLQHEINGWLEPKDGVNQENNVGFYQNDNAKSNPVFQQSFQPQEGSVVYYIYCTVQKFLHTLREIFQSRKNKIIFCTVLFFLLASIKHNAVESEISEESLSNDNVVITEESSNSDNKVNIDKPTENNKVNVSKEDKIKPQEIFASIISDETLRLDFINACSQIGMDIEDIKDFDQISDWVSGTRYSFTYLGGDFLLYCNTDSTVNCIKLGSNTDIYKQGYEPYQVSDYIADSFISTNLQTKSKEYVKSQLNYPSTADFHWLAWSYGRERSLYSVSSYVTAKNAFGVKEDIAFSFIYQVDGNSTTLVYFKLGGNIIVNHMDSVSVPERKKVEIAQANTELEAGAIILKDGELGEYGKIVNVDGSNYINYYIPAGTYTVNNKGKWCKIYLTKDECFKNVDGYTENEIVETIEFSKYGESKTLIIGSGEHLELTIGAIVSLIPNN